MRIKPHPATLPLLLLAISPATLANGDVDLLAKMSQLQYLSHKAELAVNHENRPLAGFYAHELEETLEAVEEIESYDGHPVGELAKAMLRPPVEQLGDVIDDGSREDVNSALDGLVRSCNACHQATEHGFIRVQRGADNHYMQEFAPAAQGQ